MGLKDRMDADDDSIVWQPNHPATIPADQLDNEADGTATDPPLPDGDAAIRSMAAKRRTN